MYVASGIGVTGQVMTTSSVLDTQVPEEPASLPADPCSNPLSRVWLGGAAAVTLIVSFAQSWGLVEDDTKLPLVMAPLDYIAQSFHIWNQQVFGGAAQQTGLLFPMSLFFAVTDLLHVPTWCAERLWLALLLTVGFWGLVRVAEALGIGTRSGRVLGGVAYCVAPIVVTFADTSGDLLAIVLLPWMLLPLIVGSRQGSPRQAAARSGVAVALMGGANAAVVFATLPVGLLWLVTRAAGPRRQKLIIWWLVALGLAVFWWLLSVWLEGKYGFNYLPFTETSVATTRTASAFEALRGASYWLDYYALKSPLLPGAWTLVSAPFVIVGTAVVAALGLAGLCRRIPERLFLISCLTLGVVVISVGYAGPLGGPFAPSVQHLLQTVLAPLRNVSKFSPDVALPLALGLAWCVSVPVSRIDRRRPFTNVEGTSSKLAPTAPRSLVMLRVVAVVAVVLAAAPFWQQNLYRSGGFTAIPSYWTQVGNWLDGHQGHDNAMLVPGAAIAGYSWGTPGDEPLQFLSDTSVESRNLVPIGSEGYIQMLDAVETVLDNGITTPGLAEYLSRGGIRYVIERNDLNWRADGAPPPAQVHQVLSTTNGLKEVAAFGPVLGLTQVTNTVLPVYGSTSAIPLKAAEIFEVKPQSEIVRTYPVSDPVVVSGDVGSLLPLAGAGLLTGRASVLSGDPQAQVGGAPGATWAITDGNQLRYTQFGSIRNNNSYLLAPGQVLGNAPPEVPKTFQVVSGLRHETVSDPVGAASVSASSFSSSLLLEEPNEGPAAAFDNDPSSAWVADALNRSVGQWIAITFRHKIPMSSIVLTPLRGNRYQPEITSVTISTDHGSVVRSVPVNSASVRLSVPRGSSRYLRITIDAVTGGVTSIQPGSFQIGAGIKHVSIPGISFTPRMKVPDDESTAFSGGNRNSSVVAFSRQFTNPNYQLGEEPSDDPAMARLFTLPKTMNAAITGYAIATTGSSLDQLLDNMSAPPSALTVQTSASSWLGDLPVFRPQNLVDTASQPWIAGQNDQRPSITLSWKKPESIASIGLTLSRLTSRPTEISLSDSAGFKTSLPVPRRGGFVHFSPVTTNSLTIGFESSAPRLAATPAYGVEYVVPVGLSKISIPGLVSSVALPASERFTSPCGQGPTLSLNGVSTPTALVGTVGDLMDFRPMPFLACVPKAGLSFPAGSNTFAVNSGQSPFEVTSVVIESVSTRSSHPAQRTTTIDNWSADARTVSVDRGPASVLAIAQNYNPGWRAKMGTVSLQPIRIDGWQQGFEIPAGVGGTIAMVMAPDGLFRLSLLLGAIFLVVLGFLALWPVRKRGPEPCRQRALPSFWVLLVAALVVLILVAGPLALAALPLFVVARTRGTRWLAVTAFVAFCFAGIAAALVPASIYQSSPGALGAPAQAASVVALAAVLASLADTRLSTDSEG